MIKLSININKPALLRNARGGNLPNLSQIVKDCERFGAEGITVHPRPDERHITYSDVPTIKNLTTTEYNIEGYPTEAWLNLVLKTKPTQATLVPDSPEALTSNAGWDTIKHKSFLKEILQTLKAANIRTALFMENDFAKIEMAKKLEVDRIELYTGPYAEAYHTNPAVAIESYIKAANYANEIGLGLNAGHDLNLDNLKYFASRIPKLKEVSIGHALWCDAIYLGLENAIMMYKRLLTIV